MAEEKSMHSICRWTFNAGKGGFVPSNVRPQWAGDRFSTADMIRLVGEKVAPRLPKHVGLGVELHYDAEICEKTVDDVAAAMKEAGMHLAMITPGAHCHWAYGGIASLDPKEREAANTLGKRTVDLAYGPLKDVWHPEIVPTLVLWNGSFGYDIASVAVRHMYNFLKKSVAGLCKYEQEKGGEMYIGFEPKPNEGHPAMLIPTVASALVFWNKLAKEYGINIENKGVNKEFGHSEMIGLDHVYDSVEELDNDAMVHMHLNSQGYNDGVILGGPGKYDIDNGARINGMNIAIAGLIQESGYARWKGHDMQARAYDNEKQAIDRVVRSVISWEACEQAARVLDTDALMKALIQRETAIAEDMMHESVVNAHGFFKEMYTGSKVLAQV
ncbi:MAG: xylose isomerase [Fibrobacteria bacterium]|nr:xylose isomerase [Fibrobacteria bacterium]